MRRFQVLAMHEHVSSNPEPTPITIVTVLLIQGQLHLVNGSHLL